MENRFDEKLKESKVKDELQEEIIHSSFELATEIAKKGSEGVELTPAEKKFIGAFAKMAVTALMHNATNK